MSSTYNIKPLLERVRLFEHNLTQYKSGDYDESNTRTDFVDKFFECLGWDIANAQGFSELYREVIREDRVTIDGSQKAPDYSFRVGGTRKFFVEAKKPSVNIKDAAEPAYQLRRYGYTAKLPISILTNFEEFAVYDTRIKPHKNDDASKARIFYCTFDKYENQFEFLCNTFSKHAIQKGAFDKYIGGANKKGMSEVDTELLNLIEDWRVELAKNIAKNNSALSIQDLNVAVQRIIDRIVFLRIAEDRGIEDEKQLFDVAKTKDVYEKLNQIFIRADKKYNAGLFAREKWIEKLCIDDKILSDIIVNLYYPESPYEFSVLPIEILGSIYERFLGKTIRFRGISGDRHTAIIENKPEVKKAGGVFYTPQYIVDYIVQNTVGEKIKNLTPKEIAKIKICDPACGSGSFLVGAYRYLLNFHLNYYTQPQNIKSAIKAEKIFDVANKTYKLTIEEKQRILTNNIYGVDIDGQAVEVTKLSLYLKLLESEGKEAMGWLFKYSERRLLPPLENNIKCGNSLIGPDFNRQIYFEFAEKFAEDEKNKINCFDWKEEFASVFNAGGFDVIIGNPPYFNIQTLGAKSKVAHYIQAHYPHIWQDKSDILFYFVAKAMELSKDSIGYILSNAFLFSDKAQNLRNAIVKDGRLAKIVNFEQYQVFKGASITSGIFIFNKEREKTVSAVLKEKSYTVDDVIDYINDSGNYFKMTLSPNSVFAPVDGRVQKLNKKIDGKHQTLQDICLVGKGMETAANDIFCFDKRPSQFPKRYIKKRMVGENIGRYYLKESNDYVLYFEDVEKFEKLPVSIQEYLKTNKKILSKRADKKRRPTAPWWNYTFALHKEYYHLPKIWCSYRSKENAFVLDETSDYIGLTNVTVIFGTNPKYPLKYILAILNSKLFAFRYKSIAKQTGSGVFEYLPNGLGKFPIPEIAEIDKKTLKQLIEFVDRILLVKKWDATETSAEKKSLRAKQFRALCDGIDEIVYELYGLTEKEIEIIERC